MDLSTAELALATEFSEAIRAIYDAALTPESWPAALSRVGALFGGAGAAIVFWRENTQAELIYSPELAASVEVYVAEEWWRRDLFAQRAIGMSVSVGDVVTDFDLATPVEIESHPIYTQFFHRFGLGWMMSAILLPDRDSLVTLTLPRDRAKGPYAERDVAFLKLVARHVEHALRLSLRLGELESSDLLVRAALDALDAGVFALDAERRLVMSNRSGAARFDDCFAVLDGRVVARRQDEAEKFEALLAAAEGRGKAAVTPRACVLTGPDARRSAVWALPLSEASRRRIGVAEPTSVLLLFKGIERDSRVDPALIRDVFRLSLGEARIASLIGSGVTIREAADTLGIAEGTARLVLKHVFRKLGLNRQAELALRIAALGGVVGQ